MASNEIESIQSTQKYYELGYISYFWMIYALYSRAQSVFGCNWNQSESATFVDGNISSELSIFIR